MPPKKPAAKKPDVKPAKAAPAPQPAAPTLPREGPAIAVKAPSPAKPRPTAISHDQIARRAFEIYAGRGYTPGDPSWDWAEAERQLRAGR